MQDSVKMQGNDDFQIEDDDYLSGAGKVSKRLRMTWSHEAEWWRH